MVAEIERLIQELTKLSKVYIQVRAQENIYKKILMHLREIYISNREEFSDVIINRIKELKGQIESTLDPDVKQRIQLVKLFPGKRICKAESYFKAEAFTPRRGTVVFHETDYFIGIIDDWKPVRKIYEIRNLKDGLYAWHRLENLVVLGTCNEKIWNEDMWNELTTVRVTHCWNCKTYLCPGDKVCGSCNWYVCPECNSCQCDFVPS
uniref:hypothetical protein n=1 Tax=Trichocoleus desertorum TaxID=1481672 RepID=UPI0025B50366|nr:hypothetical protein [Trichocoleus desertorum]